VKCSQQLNKDLLNVSCYYYSDYYYYFFCSLFFSTCNRQHDSAFIARRTILAASLVLMHKNYLAKQKLNAFINSEKFPHLFYLLPQFVSTHARILESSLSSHFPNTLQSSQRLNYSLHPRKWR
jgi:hypothetical protein